LGPRQALFLNTLGVVHYRSGRYSEAIATLERSLAAGLGRYDGFDLFFLSMAHYQLGHHDLAKACYERALRWLDDRKGLNEQYTRELAVFRAEAEAVLACCGGELPTDVFAAPR
jgi:tetratricopeptide (TPR) repeat protein